MFDKVTLLKDTLNALVDQVCDQQCDSFNSILDNQEQYRTLEEKYKKLIGYLTEEQRVIIALTDDDLRDDVKHGIQDKK